MPLADTTLMKVPESAHDEEALFAGDVLSTGAFVAELGGVQPGSSVAVLGAGPVGLMACVAAVGLRSRSARSLPRPSK